MDLYDEINLQFAGNRWDEIEPEVAYGEDPEPEETEEDFPEDFPDLEE